MTAKVDVMQKSILTVIERAFQTAPQSYNLLRIRRWQILIGSCKDIFRAHYP